MSPAIRVDQQVWEWLKSQARPLEDTPNSVLRRVAGLDEAAKEPRHAAEAVPGPYPYRHRHNRVKREHTPQADFREPVLLVLHDNRGHMERSAALRALEAILATELTDADRDEIESGGIRWQKSVEWQIHLMRQEGLIEPVATSGSGTWRLSSRGAALADQVKRRRGEERRTS